MSKRTKYIRLRAAEQDEQELAVVAEALQRSKSDSIRFLIHKAARELASPPQPAVVQA